MRAFDAHAIETYRVPSLLLMENAGRGAADVLVREVFRGEADGRRAVAVCGIGNNGGDGLVVARHLLVRGAKTTVFLVGASDRVSTDTRANLDAWRGLGGDVQAIESSASLARLGDEMQGADVVVDALFGTGLDRPIEGLFADAVRAVNAASTPRFAIDLPSGLDADTGADLGVSIAAHHTVTFAHPKLGLLTANGALRAGCVHTVDLGVPRLLPAPIAKCAYLLEEDDLFQWLPPRSPGAHKTSAGHVLVVGGSPGKMGAPQLVARGALRGGAGLATIATWDEVARAIESHVLEAMTARIHLGQPGKSIDAILDGKSVVVLGPGLGLGAEARTVVDCVLASWKGPLVIDADALTMLAGRPGVLGSVRKAIVTPHPGEAARLLGTTAAQVEADRFAAARKLAIATGAVVVLKGAHTIVAAPDARVSVSPVACPALATAGAGDVLGGVIAALSSALGPFEAACAGVMLHGLAGQAWSQAHGGADRGLLASEIADEIPNLGRATTFRQKRRRAALFR
jgi:NAD(P)H-hydrate epimerase